MSTSFSFTDPINRGTIIVFGVVVGGTVVCALLRIICLKLSDYRETLCTRDASDELTAVVVDNPSLNPK